MVFFVGFKTVVRGLFYFCLAVLSLTPTVVGGNVALSARASPNLSHYLTPPIGDSILYKFHSFHLALWAATC